MCLKNRADKVCNETHHSKEVKHLRKTFHANGYLKRMIEYSLRKPTNDNETMQEPPEGNPKFLLLPYVKGLSE